MLIGFKNNKNLKSHLVRATLPDINEVGRCTPCGGKRPSCQLCSNMKNTITFKSKHFNEVYQIKKTLTVILKWLYIWENLGFAESNTMVVPWQHFVLESITIKAHIIIFGKNKNCQTESVTRKIFMNIICIMTIIGFVSGDHNNRPCWNGKVFKAKRNVLVCIYLKLKTYASFDLNECDV